MNMYDLFNNDPQIREMRKLRRITHSAEDAAMIGREIRKRKQELMNQNGIVTLPAGMVVDPQAFNGIPEWIQSESPPAIPSAPICDCGAKHTSFPNHHLGWCSLNNR